MKFFTLVLFMLSFTAVAMTQPEILAHWRFELNGEDASGNGHTAEILNGTVFSKTDAAEGQHAIGLTGANYLRVDAFDLGDQFTITGWAFLEFNQSNIQTIIGNCEGGSRIDGFKLFVNNWETANRRLIVEPSDGVNRIDVMTPVNTVEEAAWNHFAVTFDRTQGLIDIYYNGEKKTENNITVAGFQTTEPLYIGSMAGPAWHWHGMLDDMRIYAGILDEDEIEESMDPLPSGVIRKAGPGVPPKHFRLGQNYPNPFNATTIIPLSLDRQKHVKIEIVDRSGRVVDVLQDAEMPAGEYRFFYNAHRLSSGMYLCRIMAGEQQEAKKILLLK